MKPHDELTIIRNRHRARELRLFREVVETYFERSERDVNDMPMDWEGAQAARSRINQMLAGVIQVVRAAGVGGTVGTAAITDPGGALGRVEVLQRIFSVRTGDGVDQEILDVLDMALGVYDGGRYLALARTINPLHYVATALAFVARLRSAKSSRSWVSLSSCRNLLMSASSASRASRASTASGPSWRSLPVIAVLRRRGGTRFHDVDWKYPEAATAVRPLVGSSPRCQPCTRFRVSLPPRLLTASGVEDVACQTDMRP